MKKQVKYLLLVLLIALVLMSFTSCFTSAETLCYYGYFESDAFVLIYNGRKNTLYYVLVPTGVINRYAREEGFDLFTESLKDFVGLEENGTILSNKECFVAIKEVLDAYLGESGSKRNGEAHAENGTKQITEAPFGNEPLLQDIEKRLQIVSNRAGDFLEPAILERINILCGIDLSLLFKKLNSKNAKAVALDSSTVITEDLGFSRDYFRRWISQIYN